MLRKHPVLIAMVTMFLTVSTSAHARLLLYPGATERAEYDPSVGSVLTGVGILVLFGFLLWFFALRSRKDSKKSD